jgi:penicillin-binding protein 1A
MSSEPTPPGAPERRPRVYKLRLALIVAGLGMLGAVSTVFGMMMAVAQDLPSLENRDEYKRSRNSTLLDVNGKPLGVLTGSENRILLPADQIAPVMRGAVIAIEDERFMSHNGIDPRGIGRALFADLTRRKAVQGASTIPQQFVKNALATQAKRTIFEKLREAALAYHLTRKWSKNKILTEYLNSVYFGNGAYGVESAARVYFANKHLGCGQDGGPACAAVLEPAEAAMLAGLIASPYAWDPVNFPVQARLRRDQVLKNMLQQHRLQQGEYDAAVAQPVPTKDDVQPPSEDSKAPYFTSWVKAQVVDRFGATKAFSGGLKIRTTLDLDLQQAADQAVTEHLSGTDGLAASVVVIDNETGEVRAMVGGRPGKSYGDAPFNLATQGQRQPGSSFKVFTLAAALREGITPDSTWESRRKVFDVKHSADPNEKFIVNNYEGQYSGVTTLSSATAESDNSVFAEVGLKVGTGKVARVARQMGIRTPVSTNEAMTLGGLKQGVTPLDMAHAYEVFAAGGKRVTGTLGASEEGPVGIKEVVDPLRHRTIRNQSRKIKVFNKRLVEEAVPVLQGVVQHGTGTSANTGGFVAGKTGTTENYGDAWFVGFNKRWTVAVWVGYPDSLKPMKYEYNGGPVTGGSFPADIFQSFVTAADGIVDQRAADLAAARGQGYTPPDGSSTGSSGGGDTGGGTSTTDGGGGGGGDSGAGGGGGGGGASGGTGAGGAAAP